MKQSWPAAERNKAPILELLLRVLPHQGTLLEVASGSGQHAVHFAAALPELRWLPSDVDTANLASIRAWRAEACLSNLAEPLTLDVHTADWSVGVIDAAFNANMIHIAPWACALALLEGVARHLRPAGVLVMYGPYRVGGEHTSESNAAFDASLRARDPSWGVRDVEAVSDQARDHGLDLHERVPMAANNFALVFRKRA